MSKGHILVVEDNLDNYELVRFILERNGYDTFLAVNGQDGVAAARLQQPDLIVMDLSLPGLDGWDATFQIKSDPRTREIPLLALTAHTLPSDRKRALDAGVDGYLTKPFELNELVQAVEMALQKRRGGDVPANE
ncbi:MAG: response regulator [Anaerolineales bacterium]